MKRSLTLTGIFLYMIILNPLFAQRSQVHGVVNDRQTGETLIGANILIGHGLGTITDDNGRFSMTVDPGTYELQVSYVGFETVRQEVTIENRPVFVEINLQSLTLDEVVVVADVARSRETPVAFTNVLPRKIQEELGNQDIPLILNSTPGVYATQSGGGDGDARITIRGFNQRNVAVLLDGVPVNDMENGWVYWSNWFGLDAVTRTIQVQRGLGASKLALPAVGGTINILTKGIENKRSGTLEQTFGNDGFMRTNLGFSSGQLKNNWSFTLAGSYKQGNGWVEQTWTKGWFYFLRLDKKIGNHLFGISGMGAPQSHAQRSYTSAIKQYSTSYATGLFEGPSELYQWMSQFNQGAISPAEFYSGLENFGLDSAGVVPYYTNFIDTVGALNNGVKYNPHWGWLQRFTIENGDTIYGEKEKFAERINRYHKPQFTFRHFWQASDRLTVSNIAYLSVGRGGGVRLLTTSNVEDKQTGYLNLQSLYNTNYLSPDYATPDGQRVHNYFRILKNEHVWYGMLSTLSFKATPFLNLSGGVDLRSYTGKHYDEIYDMFGGDYTRRFDNPNQPSPIRKEGDILSYHNDGLVKWGGLFFQAEYTSDKISTFINLTGANSGYKRIDYFLKKVLDLGDTILNIGYRDTIMYKGELYHRESPGLEYASVGWKWFPGFTVKGGVNYNITKNMNAFVNLGYLDKAPRFNNVFYYDNVEFTNVKNEKVAALEAGYNYHSPRFTANLNVYHTRWTNRPFDYAPLIRGADGTEYRANINGINAIHKGIELDFVFKIRYNLFWEGLVSLGDWRYNTRDSLMIFDNNQNFVESRFFNTMGVHVGDAAQTQLGTSLRYEPVKGWYVTGKLTWFSRHYAQFDPITLDPDRYPRSFLKDGSPRDSWLLPEYYLFDIHTGYRRNIGNYRMGIRLSILNILDADYITDAQNNDQYTGQTTNSFDARSSGVFFGLGRRFTLSVSFDF